MLVSELNDALFKRFPSEDAESWDHVGLSVGNPQARVETVFISLDATVDDVHAAHEAGAQVLVSHHPVYIDAPEAFTPNVGVFPQASAAVYEAARLGISILSYHTNLDRSIEAQEELPRRLGAERIASLEHPDDPSATGLGSYADLRPLTVQELAERASSAFGVNARVWGEPAATASRCAFLGGSLGHFGELALGIGAQAVVTGEAGYHVCQDVSMRGLAVILLGHDISERPFCNVLARACEGAGIEKEHIVVSDFRRQWWTYMKEIGHE